MSKLIDEVLRFFENDRWRYQPLNSAPRRAKTTNNSGAGEPSFTPHRFDEETSIVQTWFSGNSGQWNCFAQERVDASQLIFYSIFPVNVPPETRHAAAEFITRANYAMNIGNFEMDYDDGHVRFKTSIDVKGELITETMIRQLIYLNVLTMDRYLPGLMRVIYGGILPSEAVAEIENSLVE
ncbi:MAG TPA: YbjN domain-containing protein [Anaerolineaceae bacterium]